MLLVRHVMDQQISNADLVQLIIIKYTLLNVSNVILVAQHVELVKMEIVLYVDHHLQ